MNIVRTVGKDATVPLLSLLCRMIARLLSRRSPGGPVPVVTHLVAIYFEGRKSHVHDLAAFWEAFELRFGWNDS